MRRYVTHAQASRSDVAGSAASAWQNGTPERKVPVLLLIVAATVVAVGVLAADVEAACIVAVDCRSYRCRSSLYHSGKPRRHQQAARVAVKVTWQRQ